MYGTNTAITFGWLDREVMYKSMQNVALSNLICFIELTSAWIWKKATPALHVKSTVIMQEESLKLRTNLNLN